MRPEVICSCLTPVILKCTAVRASFAGRTVWVPAAAWEGAKASRMAAAGSGRLRREDIEARERRDVGGERRPALLHSSAAPLQAGIRGPDRRTNVQLWLAC